MKVHILPDLEAVSNKAAEMFTYFSEKYIRLKGMFVTALSGGSTPKRLYSILSSDKYMNKVDWQHVHIFQADERFVPPYHRDSNYRMIKNTLLRKIAILSENIHPIMTDLSSPALAARKYEKVIQKFFQIYNCKSPAFDLVLLGIGEDGHTASLFPENRALRQQEHLVSSVREKTINHLRITLTLPAINMAKNIIFMVSGKKKALILKKVLEERDASFPASMIHPEKGNLFFLIDNEASLCLTKK